MHLFVPNPTVPLIFNVDTHVGERAPNGREDVLLVQFLLYCVVQKLEAVNEQGRATQARVRAVPLSGVCDAATIDGIRAWQESAKPKAVVDGRVSPARGVYYGSAPWSIVELNFTVRKHYRQCWPRLQDLPKCPPELSQRTGMIL